MRLIDRFTTQHGSWDVDVSKPYGISLAALHKYGNESIPGKGGDHHIFVKARPNDQVYFNTTDGKNPATYYADHTGWVNHPLFQSSGYVPARGEQGPWIVSVNGVEITRGIGLPDGLHVSTFLVTGDEAPAPVEPNPITQREYLEWARWYIDKALEMSK